MQPNGTIWEYFSYTNVKAACMFTALSAMTTKNYEFLVQNHREIAKTYFYIFIIIGKNIEWNFQQIWILKAVTKRHFL